MTEPSVIFINSFVRSGSTLLGVLLGSAPDVAYVGESKNFDDYLLMNRACACGAPVRTCTYWRKIIERHSHSSGRTFMKPRNDRRQHAINRALVLSPRSVKIRMLASFSERISELVTVTENMARFYQVVSESTYSGVVCDSSHKNILARTLSWELRDRLLVVQLIRDGRAVTHSMMHRTGCSAESVARGWKQFQLDQAIVGRRLDPANVILTDHQPISFKVKKLYHRPQQEVCPEGF